MSDVLPLPLDFDLPYWKVLDSDRDERDGTHDYSIGEYDCEEMKDHSHTHCPECDKPNNTTYHFMGTGGIMCNECADKRFSFLKDRK